jgi:hypothetical protein
MTTDDRLREMIEDRIDRNLPLPAGLMAASEAEVLALVRTGVDPDDAMRQGFARLTMENPDAVELLKKHWFVVEFTLGCLDLGWSYDAEASTISPLRADGPENPQRRERVDGERRYGAWYTQ